MMMNSVNDADDTFNNNSNSNGHINNKKEKKRKCNSNSPTFSNKNPLAKARGKSSSHSNIWFKRNHFGCSLFVQYYTQQPTGTVCCNHRDKELLDQEQQQQHQEEEEEDGVVQGVSTSTISSSSSSNTRSNTSRGAGLSRAAKRRKKKKRAGNAENSTTIATTTTTTASITQTPTPTPTPTLDNKESFREHQLLLAMTKLAGKYKQQTSSTGNKNETSNTENENNPLHLKEFLLAMAQPLPVTFRIRKTLDQHARQQLQVKISEQLPNVVPAALPSSNSIYQVNCAKHELSKKAPKLKQFLLDHSIDGTIARQELGSMLPVLALEAASALSSKKNKKLRLLDVCASPGSKTLQLLELVHCCQNHTKSRILANDVSETRLQSLKEAVERSGVPLYHYNNDTPSASSAAAASSSSSSIIGYSCTDARHLSTSKAWDVIVCDVPCSGDGTIRKDPHILNAWKPQQGHALHSLQVQILLRSLSLLKPTSVNKTATLCYSTCSLNPIENEAVVVEALRQFHEQQRCKNRTNKQKIPPNNNQLAAEIIPFPELDGFQRRPGIRQWKVADFYDDFEVKHSTDDESAAAAAAVADGSDHDDDESPRLVWYDTYEDAMMKGGLESIALPSMWPPKTVTTSSSTANHNNNISDNTVSCRIIETLHECTRLWPQDHDSGGFFLALIRRNY